jgi:hypothetical protein
MNALEQRIIRHLSDQATFVQAPSDLAERCLRRAGAIQRRRRATAVAGVAAAVAVVVAGVAVLSGALSGGGPDRHTPPATHSAPTATPSFGASSYPDPVRFRPWFQSLPQGESNETLVGLPHGPTFQYQGVTYRRPRTSGDVQPIGTTVRGLLAVWWGGRAGTAFNFNNRIVLLQPDGTFRTLATGNPMGGGRWAGVSADGTKVAYSVMSAGSRAATVTAQDVRTGQRWTKTSGRYPRVTGWSGNEVVIVTTPGLRSLLWAPERGSTRTFGRPAALTSDAPASGRLLSGVWEDRGRCQSAGVPDRCTDRTPSGDPEDRVLCQSVISSAGLDTVYQGCGADLPLMISPDGRWVLLNAWKLRDLDTGSVLPFSIRPPGVGPLEVPAPRAWEAVRWDDERHMLFAFRYPLLPGGKLGLVRCDVEGRCERASQP